MYGTMNIKNYKSHRHPIHISPARQFRSSMQQSVPLSITAEDGNIDFDIVTRLQDKQNETGMETKVAVRQDQANLQVGVESMAGTWVAISGNGWLYCSYKDQDVNTL
jgi:hypothetical protein